MIMRVQPNIIRIASLNARIIIKVSNTKTSKHFTNYLRSKTHQYDIIYLQEVLNIFLKITSIHYVIYFPTPLPFLPNIALLYVLILSLSLSMNLLLSMNDVSMPLSLMVILKPYFILPLFTLQLNLKND